MTLTFTKGGNLMSRRSFIHVSLGVALLVGVFVLDATAFFKKKDRNGGESLTQIIEEGNASGGAFACTSDQNFLVFFTYIGPTKLLVETPSGFFGQDVTNTATLTFGGEGGDEIKVGVIDTPIFVTLQTTPNAQASCTEI